MLDEATSALDDRTELAVLSALEKVGKKRTVIVVAHRLSTLRNCDVIHVMGNGIIEATVSYRELLETSEVFDRVHGIAKSAAVVRSAT